MDETCKEHSAHERAIRKRIDAMDSRISQLEAQPAERWDHVAKAAATAVTAGFVGWALASLGIG